VRKPLTSRIIGLALLYCAVFFFLALLQFSSKGNFSISAGAITIRGRYLQESGSAIQASSAGIGNEESFREITGGVKIFYGGLEFNLSEDRGKGLALSGTEGIVYVNPEYFTLAENIARFGLPGGTVIVFNSFDSQRGSELRVNVELAENIEKVVIPISPRHSSLISDNGQFGVMYSGSLYSFSGAGSELRNGNVVLSSENLFSSYLERSKQQAFEPADYIITQSQNYYNEIQDWINANYLRWNQGGPALQNEDDVIAYCAQSLARGSYQRAIASIPGDFLDSVRHTYRSSGYTGGMVNAYHSFTFDEREKLNLITRLTREKSLELFKEEHVLDYLLTRNYTPLANDVINFIQNADPQDLLSDHCPGLLEIYADIAYWRPSAVNSVEHLTEKILSLVSENLTRITESGLVLADNISMEFSLRLGKALVSWAVTAQNAEWELIGKSLVLSALASAENNAGRFHNILGSGENIPRAARLTEGHWAWTVSPSARAYYTDGNLNFSVNFPVDLTHYVIIQGVRPFIKIQIHGIDFRSDSQFERYDSSGWVYYSQDQILILKLKHRLATENVKVVYRLEEPPPVTEEGSETAQANITGNAVS
jgi:hypothetical protein